MMTHESSAHGQILMADIDLEWYSALNMSSTPTVLERLLNPSVGNLPAEYAKELLCLEFTASEKDRYLALSEKAQLGTLSEEERMSLEELLTANDLLMILHAKAKSSLKPPSAA